MLVGKRTAAVWLLVAGLVVAPVTGQQRVRKSGPQRGDAVPDRAVSEAEKSEILSEISAQLRQGYVFEEKGAEFAVQIDRDLAAGTFDEFDRLETFVGELSPYLFEMSNDKHLRVWGRLPAAPTAPAVSPSPRPRVRSRATEAGFPGDGFASHELLEGAIGYVDLRGFAGDPAAKPSADAAMMALEGAQALILDLRQNPGGGPFMVRYLSGFLFAEPTHLASTMMRGMEAPRERWTLHDGLPTRAFVDVPVYVLTSRETFSAAESFTFGLKVNDRITQVGERTGGGGHFGQTVMVGDGIEMFLPTGRTYDPATGLGWEAEGLEPDIQVPADEALQVALETIRTRAEMQSASTQP